MRLVIVEPKSLTALLRAGTNLPLLGVLVGLTARYTSRELFADVFFRTLEF